MIFVGLYDQVAKRNFKAAIISDAYKVQKYSKDKSEYYNSKTALQSRKIHKLTSESDSSHTSSSESNSNSEHSKTGSNINVTINKATENESLSAMKRIKTTIYNEPLA